MLSPMSIINDRVSKISAIVPDNNMIARLRAIYGGLRRS